MSLPEIPADATPAELLHRFAGTKCGKAFAELVRRYAGLVTGTAARVMGSREATEDVAQEVFALLARKASAVEPATLAGWLHRVAVRRATAARRRREVLARRDLAAFMNTKTVTENAPDPQWVEVLPVLDRALDSLPVEDRAVVMLRYYEQLSWHEIAARLPLSADAARKRNSRALERLERTLRGRGFSTTVAALAAGLAAQWKAEAAGAASPQLAAVALTKAGKLSAGVVLSTTLATMEPARWAGFGAAAACLVAGGLALPLLLRSTDEVRPANSSSTIVKSIAGARPAATGMAGTTASSTAAATNRPINGAGDVYQENITPAHEERLVEIRVNRGDRVAPQTVVAVMDSSQHKFALEALRSDIIARRSQDIRDEDDKLINLENELRQLQEEETEDRAIIQALEIRLQEFEREYQEMDLAPEVMEERKANDKELTRVRTELARAKGRNSLNAIQIPDVIEAIERVREIRGTYAREKWIFSKYDLLHPEVARAQSLRDDEKEELAEIKARLDGCEIRTVAGGTVDRIGKEPGEIVKPGEGILKIVGDPREIVCFLPLDDSREVRAGDIVWVAGTGERIEVLETKVIRISPRMDNNPAGAASLFRVLGRDVVLAYPEGAMKDGWFLLLPGQTVIVHLSKPGGGE